MRKCVMKEVRSDLCNYVNQNALTARVEKQERDLLNG